MDKLVVVLDNKDIVVRLEGKALRVERPEAPLQRFPLGLIEQVVVYGSPLISSDVWRALVEYNISAVVLPARGKGESAWLGSGLSTSIMVRIRQYQGWNESSIKNRVVCEILRMKIMGQYRLMTALGRGEDNNQQLNYSQFGVSEKKMTKLVKKAETELQSCFDELDPKKGVDKLRGLEGYASKTWFDFLSKVLHKRWKFTGRNRRPPQDPVNALLSLSYTLLVSIVSKEVQSRGLDPSLGFLHEVYPGRVSFVLDVAEPFRPGVDAFVLGLLGDILSPEDFSQGSQEGCRLKKEGRGVYYKAWNQYQSAFLWFFDDLKAKKIEKGEKNNRDSVIEDEQEDEGVITDTVDGQYGDLSLGCKKCISSIVDLWPE